MLVSISQPRPLRSVVALAACLWLFAGGLAEFDHLKRVGQGDGERISASVVGAASAVLRAEAAHAAVVCGSMCSRTVAAAVLPRSAPDLAVSAMAVVVVAAVRAGEGAIAAGRGPPGRRALVLTGRDLLTRLCLLRR